MIFPNALRLLGRLGIYEYNFERITFKNSEEVTTDFYYFGDEHLYGPGWLSSRSSRVYRQVLLTELRNMATRLGIPTVYARLYRSADHLFGATPLTLFPNTLVWSQSPALPGRPRYNF
jgi:hypothetical protein